MGEICLEVEGKECDEVGEICLEVEGKECEEAVGNECDMEGVSWGLLSLRLLRIVKILSCNKGIYIIEHLVASLGSI